MIYPGKREPVLLGVLALDGLVTLAVAGWLVWRAVSGNGPHIFLFVAPMLVLSFLGAVWTILHSTYTIEGTDLVVRQGPIRRDVPIATIESVLPAPGALGARLQVQFVQGTKSASLVLNPEDREALLQGLAQADPGLTYDGQKLSRQAPI